MISPRDKFGELVQSVKEFRKKKADGLIIMPFYRAYDYLFQHLKLLEAQTYLDFDLLIVLNPVSDEKKVLDFIEQSKFRYGIVVAKRKEDTGSAGGFFTGEKYALENGYKYIIIADDDCLPVNKRHIETLVEAHRKGNPLVYADPVFLLDDEEAYRRRALPYYSLIDIDLVKKAGLHFAPLYMGAEDREFEDRLFLFAKPVMTESRVTHPGWHSIFVDLERSMRYRINEMLLGIPAHKAGYLYGFAVMSLCYIIFGTPAVRNGGFHTLNCMITQRYGLDSIKGFAAVQAPARQEPEFDRIVTPLASLKGAKYFLYRSSEGPKPAQMLGLAGATARKRVLVMPVNTFGALVPIIVAKETWILTKTGRYLFAENRNAIAHLLKLLLFGLLFLPFLAIGFMTLLLNWARKPRTVGYGF